MDPNGSSGNSISSLMLGGQSPVSRVSKRSEAYRNNILWQLNLFLSGPTMRMAKSELATILSHYISMNLDQDLNNNLQLTNFVPMFLALKNPSAAFHTILVIIMKLSVTEFAFAGVFVKGVFQARHIVWLHLSSQG
jgi:hypothetical protein